MISSPRVVFLLSLVLLAASCGRKPEATAPPASTAPRPSILLVTLDTTRFDSIGPDARNVQTPAFSALALQSRRFLSAYATAPQTLPSHASMLTGLYPAGHAVHENGRALSVKQPLIAERLQAAGYRTAAFVSAFTLARRFGLARGFDVYDDALNAGEAERSSQETTDRALRYLAQPADAPLFLWVHYFDPHTPYAAPAVFRDRYPNDPYRAEIAAMDAQLARLLEGFRSRTDGPKAIIVVADHGEGLGDHGEAQHGNLLYQSVMHVPLLISGPRVTAGPDATPVSTRRVFHTILDWSGAGDRKQSLTERGEEVVLGEAMAPYLDYGWQPQVMAIEGELKVIRAGGIEAYDLKKDPGEKQDVAATAVLSRPLRQALRDYPTPSLEPEPKAAAVTDEDRRQLASLGYVSGEATPVVRKDAPRPAEMAHLFPILDEASALFVREEYGRAIPLLEKILAADSHNLMAALRVAVAHSSLGHRDAALLAFRRAQSIAPESVDVRVYLALHYARIGKIAEALPMLERIIADDPDRLPAIEALAGIREKQGDLPGALALRRKIAALRTPTASELVRTGTMAMAIGDSVAAVAAFEQARSLSGSRFESDLELGVLYLSMRRLENARSALDRVPSTHPGFPMALFKRAQVSVLLNEEDRAERIERARRNADSTTRALIARERLFQK